MRAWVVWLSLRQENMDSNKNMTEFVTFNYYTVVKNILAERHGYSAKLTKNIPSGITVRNKTSTLYPTLTIGF